MTKEGWPVAQPRFSRRPSASTITLQGAPGREGEHAVSMERDARVMSRLCLQEKVSQGLQQHMQTGAPPEPRQQVRYHA